jgi:hypothetical protein
MEVQISLGLSQVFLRTGRNKAAVSELEPAFANLSPILDNFESIIAQDLLPPRMACEMLQRLMDVSVRLVDAELSDAEKRSGLGPAIGDLGEDSRRTAKHLERMRAIARSLPLLVKHFPKVAAESPALDVLAMTCVGSLMERAQYDDALAVLEAAGAILDFKLAADPNSRVLAMRRVQIYVVQGTALGHKGADAQAAKPFSAALPRMRALMAEGSDALLDQFFLSSCSFLVSVADKEKRFAEGAQLVEEMLPAAERRITDASNRPAFGQGQVALETAVYRGVILTGADSPAGKEDRAVARRVALAALDILDKHQIPFENGAEYRDLLNKR